MKCKAIMHSPPTRLYIDSTVREAIDLLIEHHMYNVPVVNRDELFVGEISTRHLIGLLLPDSISMEMGLKHTGFMRESLKDLQHRLHKVSDQMISPYVDTDIAVVYPDSPLIDALSLLYHNKYIRIPVLDRDNGQLVGGISFITLLRALENEE